MSEPTKAYRCHWNAGPCHGSREVAANDWNGAADAAIREVHAEWPHLRDIAVSKMEVM